MNKATALPENRNAGLPLDVREFGIGYWIGAIGSTLAAIAIPVFIACSESRTSETQPDAIVGLLILLGFLLIFFSFLTAMVGGIVLSCLHFRNGWRYQNRHRNKLIGGAIGFLLCAWPFVALGVLVVSAIRSY